MKFEMATVRVGKKHVIVIPSKIRKKIGLKEGDLLDVQVVSGNKILLEPVKDPFRTLGEIVGEPYDERKDEKKAEEWLKNAGY